MLSRPGFTRRSLFFRRFTLSLVSGAASLAAVAVCNTLVPLATASEIIDLRDGVRANFYGGYNFLSNPPQGDAYGWAMAFGDFDGDGYLDFFSSSSHADGPNDEHPNEYDTYMFFGRPRDQVDSVYAVDDPGVADIVFYNGGFQLACADLNNDGYDDAVLTEPTGNGRGAYVIFGAPRDQLRRVYNFKPDSPGYTPPDIHVTGTFLGGTIIDGPTPGGFDWASRSLVSGDLNGDGYADIAFGEFVALGPFGGRGLGGATYIVFGRPRELFPPVIDVDYGSALPHPDVAIYGESPEWYPYTLAIGDLDGDGMSDLVASTYRGYGEENIEPGHGEIHGFWGKRAWKPVYDTQIEEFDFAMDGSYGFSMATGDLDGDGLDELIMGSYNGDWAELPDGRLHMGGYRIFFGRPRSMWPKWSDAVEMTDVFIVGSDLGEAFTGNGPQEWGMCFSFATGNRDGDGFEDLLIGAGRGYRPSPDPFQSPIRSGRAYLLRGRPRGAWQPFIDLRDGFDTLIYGVDGCNSFCTVPAGYGIDRFGFTTAMADWDRNGLDELFISAPHADGPGNTCIDCGEVYVIYDADSVATPIPVTPPAADAALLPNYPNPFRAATTFPFVAPEGSTVSLTIYDVRGREVAQPLPEQRSEAGNQDVRWDGRDSHGRVLPSGIYFAKLRAGNGAHSRKILLVR